MRLFFKESSFLISRFKIEETGIEQTTGLDLAHGGEERFFQERVFLLNFTEHIAECAADGAGFLGAAAGDDGRAKLRSKGAGELFGDEDERADEAEIAFAGPGDRRQGTDAAGEHSVAQERFAEIVSRVTEGDDVGFEFAGDFIDGAAAEATADIAAMIGLLCQKADRGRVFDIGPIDTAILEEKADGMNGGQETCLVQW